MKVLIKRFGEEGTSIEADIPQMPSIGSSFLIEPNEDDPDVLQEQMRAFLKENEYYSPQFKVWDILWRINREPIIYVKNILRKE